MTQKSVYQRPYKTRQQRRESARRKHDGSQDSKFFWRMVLAIGLVAGVAAGFVVKGMGEHKMPPNPAAFR